MKNPLIPESVQSDLDLIANLPKASKEELFPEKPNISIPTISDPQEPNIDTIQNYNEVKPKYESINLQVTPKEPATAEEAGLRARKVYEIAVKRGLPMAHVDKNLVLYDNDAYDKQVDNWKQSLKEMSTGEQSAIMAFSGAGNLFGLTSYMSRKGWLFNEENRGNTSAFFDAVQQFHAEMNRPEITFGGTTIKLPSPAYVAGGVVKTGLEFMALPAIGTEKATTWFGKMAENSVKFATQTAIQAPTIQEQGLPNNIFIKQRALETLKSGVTGAGVGIAGNFIKNPFYRIPAVTGGFMTLTAIEGGTPEQILETGIQILGFEVLGMAQSAFKGKTSLQPVIEKAKEQVRELENVPDTEIEQILKIFADVPITPEEQMARNVEATDKAKPEAQMANNMPTTSVGATKQGTSANALPEQKTAVEGNRGVKKQFVPVDIDTANTKDDIDNVIKQVFVNAGMGDVFSARHIDIDKYRKILHLDGIASKERLAFQVALNEALKQGVPDKALGIAMEVNAGVRTITPIEKSGMVAKIAQYSYAYDEFENRLSTAKDSVEINDIKVKQEIIEKEVDAITTALRSEGSKAGQLLSFQRLAVNNRMDLLSVKNRAKKLKGSDLTEKEVEALTARVKELESTNKDIQQRFDSYKKEMANNFIKKSGTKKYKKMSKEDIDSIIGNLAEEIKRMNREGC